MSPEEKRPFLDDDSDSSSVREDGSYVDRIQEQPCRCRQSKACHRFISIIIFGVSLLFLVANIGLFICLTRKTITTNRQQGSYLGDATTPSSLANHAIGHVLEPIHDYPEDDPFVGPPSPRFDNAWSELLSPFNIRVTADEMREAKLQSFRLEGDQFEDESYLGYLEVYHQLHCVKFMVQIRHPEHYPGVAGLGMLTEEHFQHCIQALQHTIMCHADTSLSTWKWDGDDAIFNTSSTGVGDERLTTKSSHVVGAPGGQRQCVDWNRLDDWARSRAIGWDYHLRYPDEEGWFGPELNAA